MIRLRRPFLLLLLLCAFGAQAAQRDDLDRLRKRIATLQQEFDKSAASKSEAADGLRDSERAISDSNRRLRDLVQQQAAADLDLRQLQQRAAALTHDMQGQQAMLGRLLYQQYLNGSEQAYLRLLLNDDDPNRIARELQYYDYIARSRAAALKSLRANLALLQTVTQQAQHKSDEIDALRAEQQKQRQHLEQDRRARAQTLRALSAQIRLQQREIGHLQRNASRLTQLLDNLAQTLPGTAAEGAPFKSLKGRLLLPVASREHNQFGTRRPDSTLAWTGWFLHAAPNQQVKAVAAGRVVYADWLRGYGNLLIIDHGQGYMSLYGNNEALYKQVGDSLHAGDIIAAVGNSGGNADSGLYFELRFEGKPFDPAQWVRR